MSTKEKKLERGKKEEKKIDIFKKAREKKEKEKKEKEKLKKIHSRVKGKRDLDEPSIEQKIKDIKKKIKRDEAIAESGKVIKYKEGEYKGKIRNIATDKDYDPISRYTNEEWEKKEKRDKKLYGDTVLKGERGVYKGSFIKKKRTGFTDYRKKGLFS